MTIEGLRCEYAADPLGIDVPRPRLSWRIETARRGWRQRAYRVLVADSPERLAADKGTLWDSGRVESDRSVHVDYAGVPLRSRQACHWKVHVWDETGESACSAPACWEMGLLAPEEWAGAWIGLPPAGVARSRYPAVPVIGHALEETVAEGETFTRYYRGRVALPARADIVQAEFRVANDYTALIHVNGIEANLVLGNVSAPAFDFSPYLRAGENVVAIRATFGQARVAGELRVEYADGEVIRLATDSRWKAATAETQGWFAAEFDDADWAAATECAASGDEAWEAPAVTPAAPCPHLRREFALAERPVVRARLYAAALGLYEARLNGQRVGEELLAPGWTDYSRRVQYQAYDVTALLRPGANALGLILADGWYAGNVGMSGRNYYGPYPLGRCLLVIDYADGSVQTVATDESWRGADGPFRTADLLMGEVYDARRELPEWDLPGYAADGWRAVTAQSVDIRLDAQRGPGIRRLGELPAVAITEPAPGRFIFDLGQNLVGWARLTLAGKAGERITLRYGEMLKPDGTLYVTNLRSARSIDEYTLKGDEEECYEPSFTFHGFRYVEVSGYTGPVIPEMVTGIVAGSATPPTGEFACSSPLVNQLQQNIQWGQRGNFLSVPTDCPQRDERLGWMGDAQIFIRTAAFNAEVAGFFTKWLQDVVDAQRPDGAFTDIAPDTFHHPGAAGWAEAGVICPWTLYLCYGDTRIVETLYPAMQRFIDLYRAQSPDLLRPAGGYGDWLSIAADTRRDLLGTAYFAYATRLLAAMARVIGRDDDAETYQALFEEIKAAFIAASVAPDGRIAGETQTAYVLALYFDLLPDALRQAASDLLVEDIDRHGGHLSTGFLGVGYLLPTLTAAGRLDVAYRLLLNETFPSWGYSIAHGATTIWERWDGWTADHGFQDPGMNSFNHYSLGSAGEWLYAVVAGIAPDPAQPGYRHIVIRPRPGGGLTAAQGRYRSIYGLIESAWSIEGDVFTLQVAIPANTAATVWLPAASAGAAEIRDGADAVRFLRMEDGCAVFALGSGRYTLVAGG